MLLLSKCFLLAICYFGQLKVFQHVSGELVSPKAYKEIYEEIMLKKKVSSLYRVQSVPAGSSCSPATRVPLFTAKREFGLCASRET